MLCLLFYVISIVALHSLKPQDSWNPFAYPMSNHVSLKGLPIPLKLLLTKFKQASAWPGFVGK